MVGIMPSPNEPSKRGEYLRPWNASTGEQLDSLRDSMNAKHVLWEAVVKKVT